MNEIAINTNTPNIVVERGKRAYLKIKADAATMRENWRAVGGALLVGKDKTNRESGQTFSEWCVEQGFDFGEKTRADAMWLADNFVAATKIEPLITHPQRIRAAYNESRREGPLPLDLASIETTPAIDLDERSAERVVKLVKRAQTNDEGSEVAKRHVDALAKRHNTTPEKLERAAARKAPELYHNIPPTLLAPLKEFEKGVKDSARNMIESGLSREAVQDIFFKIANSL